MNSNKQQQTQWRQFCKSNSLGPQLGFLIPPNWKLTNYKFQKINKFLSKTLTKQQIYDLVDNFPDIEMKQNHSYQDDYILHDILNFFLNKYLVYKKTDGITDDQITLCKNFGEPLISVSRYLQINSGMTVNIAWNFIPLNKRYIQQPQKFSYQDFDLRYYLTDNHSLQRTFFGGSILGAFHLLRIMKLGFQIKKQIEINPCCQQFVIKRLQQVKNIMTFLINILFKQFSDFDGHYFYTVLRPCIFGFKNILVKCSQGKQQRISSPGGAGGFDPTFQLFQRMFGINFSGDYLKVQVQFRNGLYWKHNQLIRQWQQECQNNQKISIRQYCKTDSNLKTTYNKIVKEYGNFLSMHGTLVKRNIVSQVPQNQQENLKGTGDIKISRIMQRDQAVMDLMLK